MLLRSFNRVSVSVGVAIAAAITFSSPAAAIPPPDVITACPSNPTYQSHHWYMLYGGPQTMYYKIIAGTSQNPQALQSITPAAYGQVCKRYGDGRFGHLAVAYKELEFINFDLADLEDKPFVITADKESAQRFNKKAIKAMPYRKQ